MTAPLAHRGPDADGVWIDAEAGVGFGHRRLSIIDLSSAGAQPMISASGRFVISYNGEVYNTGELRPELETRGARFRGHSDTEVLLEACETWGVEAGVKRLIGMFAFALWDRLDRCLYLVRDRMGIKPLYYSATPERFIFASELTGLRAHPGFQAEIDRDAVDAFLALDYIPSPYSIFRGVRKLEPGMVLRVDSATLDVTQVEPYWTLEAAARAGVESRFPGSFKEATDELERLLSDAVKRRMAADVPLGAFLSGGVDSSSVVALMQKQSAKPIQTFSIGFAEGRFDEAPWAKAIAEHLGTDHHEHYFTSDEISQHLPHIMAHYDEPFADSSRIPTALLSRLARRKVTVALSGDGGDELFGGYDRHVYAEEILGHPAFNYSRVQRELIRRSILLTHRSLRHLLQGFLERLSEPSARLSPHKLGLLARAIHAPHLIHHQLAHGDVKLSGRAINGPCLAVKKIDCWLKESESLSPSERQQYIDAAGYLPDDILTKVDRASMWSSLEVRVPILDHRVVEFSFCLPTTMKTGTFGTKHILRQILSRYMPEAMFERPKVGFGGPLNHWMSGPLREWALDLLSGSPAVRYGLMDRRAIRASLNRLRTGACKQRDWRRIALNAWCDAQN